MKKIKKGDSSTKSVDIEKIRLISTPQYLGILFGFVFTAGVTYGTFQMMKTELNDLKKQREIFEKDVKNIETDIRKILSEINGKVERVDGKLEVYLQKIR